MKFDTPQIIPIPDDEERWECLQCAMLHDRETKADVLLAEGDERTDWSGMCGNHAEVMDLNDFQEALERLYELAGERP